MSDPKVRFLMVIFIGCLFSTGINSETRNDQEDLHPSRTELERLKTNYRNCVMEKGKALISVSDFDTAMKYAPIACKRNFLEIRRFFFGNPFQMEMSNDLLDSVSAGIEIDLINYLLDFKLKKQ
ncbi:MAG: hypothetical protein ACI92E_003371 [Oceanicoccus sp.]|jgi:hypothetical protein